jgi:hypothetical protein
MAARSSVVLRATFPMTLALERTVGLSSRKVGKQLKHH